MSHKLKIPTIEWTTDEDELDDQIYDELAKWANAGWSDQGFGRYEYWGATGYHTDWHVDAEDAYVDLTIKGAPQNVVLPEIPVRHDGGGCDGEHNGRCKALCWEWELDLLWKPKIIKRLDNGTLEVVYEGEPA